MESIDDTNTGTSDLINNMKMRGYSDKDISDYFIAQNDRHGEYKGYNTDRSYFSTNPSISGGSHPVATVGNFYGGSRAMTTQELSDNYMNNPEFANSVNGMNQGELEGLGKSLSDGTTDSGGKSSMFSMDNLGNAVDIASGIGGLYFTNQMINSNKKTSDDQRKNLEQQYSMNDAEYKRRQRVSKAANAAFAQA